MGWKRVTVMDQRVRFIAEYLKSYFPFNELCDGFNISRKTGYKWVERYEQGDRKASQTNHDVPIPVPMKLITRSLRPSCRHGGSIPRGGRRSSSRSLLPVIPISPQSQRQPISSNEEALSPAGREDSGENTPDARRPSHKSPTISGVPTTRVTLR